jgi:hypothetical protein
MTYIYIYTIIINIQLIIGTLKVSETNVLLKIISDAQIYLCSLSTFIHVINSVLKENFNVTNISNDH